MNELTNSPLFKLVTVSLCIATMAYISLTPQFKGKSDVQYGNTFNYIQ